MRELTARARAAGGRIAVCDERGEHSYEDLLAVSERRAYALLRGCTDLRGERVAYLLKPGFDHVAVQWAIWRAGGVAVPLADSHPAPETARLLADADPARLVVEESMRERAHEAVAIAREAARGAVDRTPPAREIDIVDLGRLDARVVSAAAPVTAQELAGRGVAARAAERGHPTTLPTSIEPSYPALMVYTSGTTGAPKGVVTTHANVVAQITTLVDAWSWTPEDRILHVLPLHHIHGIVNAMCCALWAGACCEFSAPEPRRVWERLASGEVTLFMAVPTIYRRLIVAWESAEKRDRERWSSGARGLRLMVSGSAALPTETLERWQQITGHRLLERYGMTEIGMALGNPLQGERRAGTVGRPFAGVDARIVDEAGTELGAGDQGELEVRGPQVFREYWRRAEETAAAFRREGWFRTGDEAILEDGYWRIVGRRGVDIIKTGGYKVSATEIEAIMRKHTGIDDVAVVGIPDEDWGERVCAAVVAADGAELQAEPVREWCKERLAPYKVPKQLVVVAELPRNAMGKVTKPALHPAFADPEG